MASITTNPRIVENKPYYMDSENQVVPQLDDTAKDAYSTLINDEDWNYNKLSDLNLVSYHIKLFQVEDVNLQFTQFETYDAMYQTIMSLKKVVILETGVTGSSIISLTADSVPAINTQSRSYAQTHFTMVVHEPGGSNFLDYLRRSSEYLGIRDPKSCAYYMTISFNGQDRYGQVVRNPCSEFDNGGVWLYQIKIIDIHQKVEPMGSTYEMTLIPYPQHLLSDNNACLPAPIGVEASTVGELYTKLAEKMNEADEDLWGYNLKTFKFLLPQFVMEDKTYNMAEWSIKSITDEEFNTKRHVQMTKKEGKIRAQFPKGMSIKDITDIVMQNCEEAQRLGKGVSTPNDLETASNKARSCIVFSNSITAEPSEYDVITNNYVINYTIKIEPYFTQRPILTSKQIRDSESIETQTNNIKMLRQAGYLSKRFDYMLTGKNTEVISLETDFKFSWAALLPISMGYKNSIESESTFDRYKDRPVEDVKKKQEKLKEVRTKLSELDDLKREEDQLKTKEAATESEKKTRDDRLKEIAAKKAEYNEAELQAEKKATSESIKKDKVALSKENKLQTEKVSTLPDTTYSEEISSDKIQNFFLPIAVQQDTSDQARFLNSGVFPDYYHRDRTILGAVMDQLYSGNSGGNMQVVEMEIRGDPYWLGPGGMMKSWQDVNNKQIRDILKNSMPSYCMDFNNGDTYCLIRFRYPVGYDDSTINMENYEKKGVKEIRESQTFTGIYQVTRVESKFDSGQFTQRLTCTRMPLIQIFKSFGYVDEQEEKRRVEAIEEQEYQEKVKSSQARSAYWKS